jgi:import receptor subunit TOM7
MQEETREKVQKSFQIIRKIFHVTWIPLVLYFGFTQSATRPSILKIISPFAG